MSGLDFFGEDNAVKDWFLQVVRYTEVDVQLADGSRQRAPLFAALIHVINDAEIVDDLFCKNWAGWTPASATVTVATDKTGDATVGDEWWMSAAPSRRSSTPGTPVHPTGRPRSTRATPPMAR